MRFRGFEAAPLRVNDSPVADLKRALRDIHSIGRLTSSSNINSSICSANGTSTVLHFPTELGDIPMLQALPHSVSVSENRKGLGSLEPCAGRGLCRLGAPVSRMDSTCECFNEYYSSKGNGTIGRRSSGIGIWFVSPGLRGSSYRI
jgi:hypothetical protein